MSLAGGFSFSLMGLMSSSRNVDGGTAATAMVIIYVVVTGYIDHQAEHTRSSILSET